MKNIPIKKHDKAAIPVFFLDSKVSGATKLNLDFLSMTCVQIAKDDDPNNRDYEISASDYEEIKGVSRSAALKQIKKLQKVIKDAVENGTKLIELSDNSTDKNEDANKDSLVNLKYLKEIEDENGNKEFVNAVFFQRSAYNEKTGKIMVRISDDFKEDMGSGKKIYIIISNYVRLSSQTAKTIYLLAYEFIDASGINFRYKTDFDAFLEKVGIDRKSYSDRKIKDKLDEAKKEIDEITDITVKYKFKEIPVKGGKKIVGIEILSAFNATKPKTDNKKEIGFEEHLLQLVPMSEKSLKGVLTAARNAGKNNDEIIEIFSYTRTRMEKAEIKQVAAYIKSLLKDNVVINPNKNKNELTKQEFKKGMEEALNNPQDAETMSDIIKKSGLLNIFDAAKRV